MPLQSQASLVAPRGKALVFISHDSRDAELAEAFGNLLSDVSAGTLKSFRSSDKKGASGIEFGAEWYKAIMTQLADATDVVALLTPQSIDRPWILYEAGVAKGKLETTVFGAALGVPLERVSTGPFGQFQNCGDDEDSLTKLVMQLIQRNPDAAPREEAVRMQVRVFRENVGKLLKTQGKPPLVPSTSGDETSVAKLFEEVKVMVQQLPDKVDERVRNASRRGGLRRLRRFHPMMFDELLMHPELRETPDAAAAAWLFFISLFRDDFPWLYEPGLDLYRALRSNDPAAIGAARQTFSRIIRVSTRGPLFHEFMRPDDDESFMMLRHLPEILEHFLETIGPRRLRRKGEPTSTAEPSAKGGA
jgi:hypothetical protein